MLLFSRVCNEGGKSALSKLSSVSFDTEGRSFSSSAVTRNVADLQTLVDLRHGP